jgi:hypothetical protein
MRIRNPALFCQFPEFIRDRTTLICLWSLWPPTTSNNEVNEIGVWDGK